MNLLSKWKIGLYLAAIFLAGIVAGSFVGLKIGARMMFRPPRQEDMVKRICGELETKLNLTPAQAEKIRLIVGDSMTEFGTAIRAQISNAFVTVNARVAAELTPEQKTKFEKLQREREEFMRKRFGDGPDSSKRNP